MAQHPIKDVFVDGSNPAKGSIRSYLMARAPLVLASPSEIQSLDVDLTISVALGGRLFAYDSTDTSTAHDGINTLVDITGRRFKSGATYAVQAGVIRALDKDLAAPVGGTPAVGAAYLLTVSPTGVWSGWLDYIAVWDGAAWRFIAPIAGMIAWLVDEAVYYHFNGTHWYKGLPGQIAAGAVTLGNMLNGVMQLVVEGTANAPSGSEGNGAAWIVGASPAGAFGAFSPAAIAVKEAGAWNAYTPQTGWRVDDKSASIEKRWSGSAWASAQGSGKVVAEYALSGSVSVSYAVTNQVIQSQAVTIGASGRYLLLDYSITMPSGVTPTIGLRRDSEAGQFRTRAMGGSGYSHLRLTHKYSPSDTSSHTYKAELTLTGSGSYTAEYDFIIREMLP